VQEGNQALFHGVDTGKKCSRDTTDIGRGGEDIGRVSRHNVLDPIGEQTNTLPRPSDNYNAAFLVEIQWRQAKFDPEINNGDDLAAQVDNASDIGRSVVYRGHVDLFVNFLDLRDSDPAPDIAHFENNPLACLGRREQC
jgi:hypothetical protein